MDCRRIEQLISLYVEGDLESKDAGDVSLHLSRCSRCSRMAADYKESQDWLRASAQIDFDESELDRLRAGVLEEIERDRLRPGFLQLTAQALTAKSLVFASAVLLILFGALAAYFYSPAPNSSVNRAENASTDSPREKAPPPEPASREAPNQAPGAGSVSHAPRKLYARHKRTRRAARAVSAPRQAAVLRAWQVDLAQPAENRLESGTDSADMLRIEIQTSNPNIRIIWFAPKHLDSQPSKPMTDTNTDTNQEAL